MFLRRLAFGFTFLCLLCFTASIFGEAAPSSKVVVPPCPQVGVVMFSFHDMQSSGSCSLVASDVILTCCHVIRGNSAKVVIDNKLMDATLIAMDFENDWCLMRLEKKLDIAPLKVSPDTPEDGEKLYGFGFGPFGNGQRWGCNRLVYKDGKVLGRFHSGDSGGPLCDSQGDIVGVCTSYTSFGTANGWSVGKIKGFVDKYKGHQGPPAVASE
jgi:S1-C subfamily serine protease